MIWLLPKYINANRFFGDSHWLEIWSNHFCPSMGRNGGSVATDSVFTPQAQRRTILQYFSVAIILPNRGICAHPKQKNKTKGKKFTYSKDLKTKPAQHF